MGKLGGLDCELAGALEHLAIAQGTGGPAVTAPLGQEHFHGPAEAVAGGIDGGIGAPGTAME
jgi:hypothetical protein